MGQNGAPGMHEDWRLLTAFLPSNWRDLAATSGALQGLRKDESPENLLRMLLIHLGCGHTRQETVVLARMAQLADLSSVALSKRLKQSHKWLRALCIELFRERGLHLGGIGNQFRAVDATAAKEPERSGSLWHVLYCLRLPALACDFFKLTETSKPFSGEALRQFPISEGDLLLADRAYSAASVIGYVAQARGRLTVQVDTDALSFQTRQGQPFDLLSHVRLLGAADDLGSWDVKVVTPEQAMVRGRVCAARKTEESIGIAQEGIRKHARRTGKRVSPDSLEFARYLIVFTTFPTDQFSTRAVLDSYRLRCQVDLVLKRFKSLGQMGHLPNLGDDSAKAWLYAKLLVALLVEKLISHATAATPESTDWQCRRPHSTWREFEFMLNEVCRAIEPNLSLSQTLAGRNSIFEDSQSLKRSATRQP
ncbi:MAG: IS4 family transposase [Bryobacterales bacterium]|nr:IS4 family transposase [Bryobacterales bacterium]